MKTHRLQHVGFVKFYNEFKKEFRKVYKPKDMRREDLQKLIDKTRKFLGDWLVNHINGQDHKYAASAGKDDSYRIYIEQLFRFLEKTGATSFLITETEQVPKIFSTTGVEEFLADGVVVLYALKHGNVRENALEILKLRGTNHKKNIVAMQITSSGIVVYPEQEVFSEMS